MNKKLLANLLFILLSMTIFTFNVFAEVNGDGTIDNPWLIGSESEADVSAYLDNGSLVISGTNNMLDFDSGEGWPWNNQKSSITTITIGPEVKNIGLHALSGCTNLTDVVVSATVPPLSTNIEYDFFEDCVNLENIYVPFNTLSLYSSTIVWQDYADKIKEFPPTDVEQVFYSDNQFTNVSSNFYYYVGETYCEKTYEFKIIDTNPYKVEIKKSPYASNLPNEIAIPSSISFGDNTYAITSIGENAFSYKDNVVSISIPDSVVNIGQLAFANTNIASIEIPNSVITIGDFCLSNCNNLEEAEINCDVNIPQYMFNCCQKLSSVNLSNNITNIDSYAFSMCSSLSNITLPENLITIGDCAFYQTNLTTVTIPEKVNSIGAYAFYGFDNMESIYVEAVNPPTVGDSFIKYDMLNTSVPKIYVPKGTVDSYKTNEYWNPLGFCFDDKFEEYSISYKVIDGDNMIINVDDDENVLFTSKAPFADFIRLEIDSNIVDPSNYTVAEGSTKVTINASFLGSLTKGLHTLSIVSAHGNANTQFTITSPEPTPEPDTTSDPTPSYKVPNTGVEGTANNNSLLKPSSLSLLAIGTYLVIKKKKDN